MMRATSFALIAAMLLAGCATPPTSEATVASIMDTTGGFAGPSEATQSRTVVMSDETAYWVRFALEPNTPGIRVVPALEPHLELIRGLMQPSQRGTVPGATVHELIRYHGAADLAPLDAWSSDAGTKKSVHQSNCADCFTYHFHHMLPGHSSTAYGFPDEFNQPWRDWADAMDTVARHTRDNGQSLGAS